MYSKAKIAGHPLHPMLVGLPITFYLITLGCFAAALAGAGALWFRMGVYSNLAAILLALLAALPGFIDWAVGVPRNSPAKRTGRSHMLLNVGALLAFVANFYEQWPRRLHAPMDEWSSVVLPALGVVLVMRAGALGWKMVQKHHVGVELTPEQERIERGETSRAAVEPDPR